MSLSVANQNVEFQPCDHQGIATSAVNLSVSNETNLVLEEDEEEEDGDFNPFLREEAPSEASSSLSSDNDGPGKNLGKEHCSLSDHQGASASSRPSDMTQCCSLDSGNEDGEIVMQTRFAHEDANGGDGNSENHMIKELSSIIQQEEGLTYQEGKNKDLPFGDQSDAAEEFAREDQLGQTISPPNTITSSKPILDISDEDAICKRTRARQSLANYTLEELESFLQESDDDGDLHNVDDEEEYRKFLTAVLLEGVDNRQVRQEDENLDDDEENDADFEVEIEEALESDADESIRNNKGLTDKQEGDSRRPETRQKKRLKESAEDKKYLSGQAKLRLRPILPYVSTAQVAPLPAFGWRVSSHQSFSQSSSSLSRADLINGFTAQQIGQLYCLIHEHVQLLIQVFSVCVLDPSRQQIASEVQKMIMEMVDRCEEALTQKKVSYPGSCFHPPNLHSSLHLDFIQDPSVSQWMPSVDSPVLSVIDVAPLRLAKSYMTDVSATVFRNRQRHVEDGAGLFDLKREPLFPLPTFASSNEADNDILKGANNISSRTASPLSPDQLQPKKSLAATLVESTKKQSVALVPQVIAKLAERFYPLFNLALFPHKPPIPAVANRVLFTDAEDGLLAMGLMEYNNDWEAIQQHFLPCKSKHQIFVRQKNRSSSKAPENPIKAVRRMKTSPLTAEEKACIYEGLKLFKHDWFSIWKFFVPHRDPSLLPRQWRIATGTQKSYKKSEANKQKRRLYEAKRRKMKALMTDGQASIGKEVDHRCAESADDLDNEDEAYVHEAFLADSEVGNPNHIFHDISVSSISTCNKQSISEMLYKGAIDTEKSAAGADQCGESWQESGASHELTTSSKPSEYVHPLSRSSNVRCNASYVVSSKPPSLDHPGEHPGSLPYQRRRSKGVRVVKLAPGLPPVNLPPSVRVISRSTFKSYCSGSSNSSKGSNNTKNYVSSFPGVIKALTPTINPGKQSDVLPDTGLEVSHQQDGGTLSNQHVAEENTSESDLLMHPLLFHVPEDNISPDYSVNCYSAASSVYNFFPGTQLRTDSNFLGSQMFDRTDLRPHLKGTPLNLSTISFHPLLQRMDNVGGDPAVTSSVDQLSGDSREGQCDKLFNQSDCIVRNPVSDGGQLASQGASPRHCEKENKLDLDIHLYPVTNEDTLGSKNKSERQHIESGTATLKNRIVDKGMHADMCFHHCERKYDEVPISPNTSVVSRSCCSGKDVSSFDMVPPSTGGASQSSKGFWDESISEIVMEQEELSDSEEESEHVEFECEEMDDSEGDGLDSGRTVEIQKKENPTFAAGGKIQASCVHRLCQSSSLARGSLEESKNSSRLVKSFQDSSHTKLQRLKPRCKRAKRDTSWKSSVDVLHSGSGRPRTARKSGSSKLHPLQTQQLNLQTASDCTTVAPRNRRKRSC